MTEQSNTGQARKPVTVATLAKMKRAGEKFAVLTAYDAGFAAILDAAGVEVVLVGDSLGMVVQGRGSTVPVSLEDMAYHSRLVARTAGSMLRMVDMPFMSYATTEQALRSSAYLMQQGEAHLLKFEGGAWLADTVRVLARNGVPVCAHLGLLPQTVFKLGGYKVQGRGEQAAQQIIDEALILQDAGADVLLVESIPAELGTRLSQSLEIPVIGIGAGPGTDAQVLVLHDILGITLGRAPKFSHNFLSGRDSILDAVRAYVAAVKDGSFPAPQHCF